MRYQVYKYSYSEGWTLNFEGSELAKLDDLSEAESHAEELARVLKCDFGVFDVSDTEGDKHLEYQTCYDLED